MTTQKLICFKYNEKEKGKKGSKDEVKFMTDGTDLKQGDFVTFASPQGPVRIRMFPADAFQPPTWQTGDPPILVLKTVAREFGSIWCGGVKDGKQWGMNATFQVPELDLMELNKTFGNKTVGSRPNPKVTRPAKTASIFGPSLLRESKRILKSQKPTPTFERDPKLADMKSKLADMNRLIRTIEKEPTPGHVPAPPWNP